MTESQKHIGFKHLVESILIELQNSGMKIKEISNETKTSLYKEEKVLKTLGRLRKLRRFDINKLTIQVYLAWSKNDELNEEDIYVNGIRYKKKNHREFSYHNTEYNESDNFSVIKLKTMRQYSFKGVNVEYDGSLFIITLAKNDTEPEITYESTERVIKDKIAKYDVTCKYKNKLFSFEIGHSKHKGRKYVLVLDYKYLESSSYSDIKKRMRTFIKRPMEN